MTRKSGGVSDAEMDILQVLWKEGPATVREVSERLGPDRSRWAYTTVQTLLGRLEAKGSVWCERAGLAHVFRAAITREEFLADRLSELADKVCDGTTMPLVMALVDRQRFSSEELDTFRRLLDEAASAQQETRNNR